MYEQDNSTTEKKLSRADLNRQFNDLLRLQTQWVPYWQDLTANINPSLGYYDGDTPNDAKRRDEQIINSTPIHANIVQAAGMQNGITSPSRPWFKLKCAGTGPTAGPGAAWGKEINDQDDVRYWIDTVEDIMYDVLNKSNFYKNSHSFYQELGAFGSACMIVEEDFENIAHFRTFTAGEYAIGLNPRGQVDRFCRKMKLTVSQIVDLFGIDNVPTAVKTAYERRNYADYYDVKHMIMPNINEDATKRDNQSMAFLDIYWMDESEEGKWLHRSGFESMPVLFARWHVKGADVYGRGPGWSALGDAKELQLIEKDIATAVELSVKPPMNAPIDALKAGGVNIMPGGVNPYNPSSGTTGGVAPSFTVQLNIQAAEEKVMRIENSINKHFFADLFRMLEGIEHTGMTAREVMERAQEKMSMIGPVLESLQGEFLRPLIMRLFDLMLRVPGLLPPPPESIQGQELKIEYVSVLAQAQRMTGITAIEQYVAFGINAAQAQPAILDKMDFDQILDEYAAALGVPPSTILGDEKVAVIRQQRAEQQQQAQQMEMIKQMAASANQGAGAINQGSQALSNVAGIPGQNPALASLFGVAPGTMQ